jgi:thiamine-monophosphate kinase
MGEFDLIAGVISRLANQAPLPSDVLVGPGDDAAVISVGSEQIVFTTDIAVEGVHFRRDWSTLRQIGAKIAAANCADCEAMGAVASTLVVALAGSVDQEMANELADGIAQEALRAGAVVVGGDMSTADQLVISIAAIGRLDGRAPVLRSGARVDDDVVLLGGVGRSAAGLALLTADLQGVGADLIADYHSPQPPYGGGRLLADAGAHAMCDVSDGLLADLGHIATASGVAIEINPDLIDLTQLIPAAAELGVDPLVWALTGGEDHALVATLAKGSILPTGAVVIGCVLEGQGVTVTGIDTSGFAPGWEHFTN